MHHHQRRRKAVGRGHQRLVVNGWNFLTVKTLEAHDFGRHQILGIDLRIEGIGKLFELLGDEIVGIDIRRGFGSSDGKAHPIFGVADVHGENVAIWNFGECNFLHRFIVEDLEAVFSISIDGDDAVLFLSLIHISEPTRPY